MAEPEILRPGVPGSTRRARCGTRWWTTGRPWSSAAARRGDVVAALSPWRGEEGLEVGVRCGGHSVVGQAFPTAG